MTEAAPQLIAGPLIAGPLIAGPLIAGPMIAGIEAGGTKFLCAIAHSETEIIRQSRIPTTTPAETIAAVRAFFAEAASDHGDIAALGIGSFGPAGCVPGRPDWGHILDTPKPGWGGVDLAGAFADLIAGPIAFDTDVNAAAFGEYRCGAGQGIETLAYITIGTGIGAGLLINGTPLHGMLHPEAGHMRPRRHPRDPDFHGICPFHADCFEGLASGKAIFERCGAELGDLPQDHPIWEIEADYIAQLCAALIFAASPQRIILGGGVAAHHRLFAPIRARLRHWIGDYPVFAPKNAIDDAYLVPPGLAGAAGLTGALALAAASLPQPDHHP